MYIIIEVILRLREKKSDTLKVTAVTRMNGIVCTRVKLAQSQTRIA